MLPFELEIIHPFEDGNGRMGRLWQSLLLSKWNPLFEWLPIESVIYEYQQGYSNALTQSNRENDATFFIEFMLQAILDTVVTSRLHTTSLGVSLSPKEEKIFMRMKQLFEQFDTIDNQKAKAQIGMSEATTRRYLLTFVQKGLLQATGATKNRRYWLTTEGKNYRISLESQ